MTNPTPEELLAMVDEKLAAPDTEPGPEPEEIPGDPHPESSNEELFEMHRDVSAALRDLREGLWLIERSLTLRMKAIGASVLETPEGVATLKENVVWNEDELERLLNERLVPYDEYKALLNAPKPQTHDKRKINALAKKGGEIKRIIESARKVTGESLVIRSRDDDTDTELAAD